MSGLELLLVLYDEAISRLKKAEIALEDQNYAVFEDCLGRVSRILRYLTDILDLKQPLSTDLRRIYEYLIYDISRIQAARERQAPEIGRISHMLSELRSAFDEAGRIAGDNPVVQNKGILG